MTVFEIYVKFKDGVDKIDSKSAPIFPVEQVDRIMNKAIARFIKTRYTGNNMKLTAFESTQKRTDDLQTLVSYININPGNNGEINTGFFHNEAVSTTVYKLPEDYWFALIEQVQITKEECNPNPRKCDDKTTINKTNYVGVQARRHNEVNALLEDPFNRPEDRYVFRTISKREIQLFHDNKVTPGIYKLGYLSEFKQLQNGVTYNDEDLSSSIYWENLEFWMPAHTHEEIVDLAVQIAVEAVADPRYSTVLGENQFQE